MQFKVPQFLDIEDKIFGPFTFRQFVYLAGGAGLSFVLYKVLGILLGLIPILVVISLSIALTFYKPNGKPFIDFLESGLKYLMQDKLYVWKRKMVRKQTEKEKIPTEKVSSTFSSQRLNKSKLQDLAWSLDVLDLTKNKKGDI